MIELLLVVVGAVLAGIVQTWTAIGTRSREVESVLTALAGEVGAICRLLRMLDYRTEIQKLLRQVEMGVHEEAIYYIDIKSDYFSVYHSLSSQLGLLKPAEVTKLVRFYSYCKTFVDATRPEGVSSEMQGRLKSVTNLRALTTLHDSILCLGDEIVQLTKSPSIPDGTRV